MKQMFKKLTALSLTLLLLLSMTAVVTFADDPTPTFTGSGTEADPFVLKTAQDLVIASQLSNSDDNATRAKYGGSWENAGNQTKMYMVYYEIAADIDMTGQTFYGFGRWDIGYNNMGGYSRGFRGIIKGNGHVISNLTITGVEGQPAGLVCRAVNNNITNLGLENVTITGGQNTGAFIGHSMNSSTLQGCYVNGLVNNGTLASGHYGKGGLAGCSYSGTSGPYTIQDCYAVNLTGNGIFGLVARSSDGVVSSANMSNCYSSVSAYSGNVTTTVTNVYSNVNAETEMELGSSFEEDWRGVNGGLPVLAWQNEGWSKVTVNISGDGTVANGETAVENGTVIAVKETDTLTLSATPLAGQSVLITYGGTSVAGNTATLTGIKEDTVVTVSFEKPFEGEGTESDPFIITTADELVLASELSNNADRETRVKYAGSWANDANQTGMYTVYYKIDADIDMTGKTFYGFGRNDIGYPNMGGYGRAFRGVIEGGNHVISNLTISGTNDYPAGFICSATSTTVRNLGLENVVITAGESAGALIGNTRNNCTIENCYVNGVVNNAKGSGANGGYSKAGMVGGRYSSSTDMTTFTNCYAVNVSGDNACGIIAGSGDQAPTGANMTNCYSDKGIYYGSSTNVSGTYQNIYSNVTVETEMELGTAFESDFRGINEGLPVLAWQNEGYVPVTVSIIGNGTVKNGETELENGDVIAVEKGDGLELTVIPAENHEFTAVFGSTNVSVSPVVLENIQTGGTLTVTFTEKAVVAPGIEENKVTIIPTADIDGFPAFMAYSKLNAFTESATGMQYGMRLALKDDADSFLLLPACESSSGTAVPAIAQPGAAFAIRVYGKAINKGTAYTMTPYIGTEGNYTFGDVTDYTLE